ncbi:MAG: MmcQ/YjbR family DNA-binding protein [Bacteroidia bacterium]|nr:MmcQ/YjbR family DNA-binding protein [Bacteroidia bacterium]
MHLEEIREYCLQKKGVEECLPFGNDTLVFKVMGKMFLLTGIEAQPTQFNAKCNPEKAIDLRENFSCILPGYHMNKKHWNTIICDGSVSQNQIKEWIDDSYSLVVSSLTKKLKSELDLL